MKYFFITILRTDAIAASQTPLKCRSILRFLPCAITCNDALHTPLDIAKHTQQNTTISCSSRQCCVYLPDWRTITLRELLTCFPRSFRWRVCFGRRIRRVHTSNHQYPTPPPPPESPESLRTSNSTYIPPSMYVSIAMMLICCLFAPVVVKGKLSCMN